MVDMRYPILSRAGEFRSGKCRTVPERLAGPQLPLRSPPDRFDNSVL